MSTPQQEEEYRKIEDEWRQMRNARIGELLSIKDQNRDFRQMPADIAIDWHKHELNVRPDRRLDKWALAISGLSFAVSAITPFKPFG